MQSGPSGPPPAGPSGPPAAGPSGPPSGAAGSSPVKVRGPSRAGPPGRGNMDEAAFERMAEQNVLRQKEIDRREKSTELKANRNSKRNNVILLLLLVVVFGGIALWPFTRGNVSNNPHEFSTEMDIINRNDPGHPMAWDQDDLDLMANKVWDGDSQFSGSFQYDLALPGIPVAINDVTTVPVEIRLISYRTDGSSSGYRLALFPMTCDSMMGASMSSLDEIYVHTSQTPMLIGTEVTVEFDVPAGRYCVVFEYESPPDDQGFKATIDAEITGHWNQPLAAPLAAIMALLAIFAGVGAHKAGKAWKKVAQPEKPDRVTTEDEVLEAAEEERGSMSEAGEDSSDEEGTSDLESPPESNEPTDEPTDEPTTPIETAPVSNAAEPAQSPPSYTDEQLLEMGWTDQQIEWHRQAEAMEQG